MTLELLHRFPGACWENKPRHWCCVLLLSTIISNATGLEFLITIHHHCKSSSRQANYLISIILDWIINLKRYSNAYRKRKIRLTALFQIIWNNHTRIISKHINVWEDFRRWGQLITLGIYSVNLSAGQPHRGKLLAFVNWNEKSENGANNPAQIK